MDIIKSSHRDSKNYSRLLDIEGRVKKTEMRISQQVSQLKKKKATRFCLTLCDPMDGSLPGCSVHGILQARMLEWVAIPFSRASSQPRDWTQVSHIADSYHLNHQGNCPHILHRFIRVILSHRQALPTSQRRKTEQPLQRPSRACLYQ